MQLKRNFCECSLAPSNERVIDSNGIMDDELKQISIGIRRRSVRAFELLSLLHCPITQESVRILSNTKVRNKIKNIRIDNDYGVKFFWGPLQDFKAACCPCSRDENIALTNLSRTAKAYQSSSMNQSQRVFNRRAST